MTVHYSGHGRTHEYLCGRLLSDYGGERCQHLSGVALDRVVTSKFWRHYNQRRWSYPCKPQLNLRSENQLWQQRLGGLQLRQSGPEHYRLVEPENRLWLDNQHEKEDKLAAQQQLQEDYQRFCAQQPRQLSADERAAIRQLAHEIPALWEAPTTTHAQRGDRSSTGQPHHSAGSRTE